MIIFIDGNLFFIFLYLILTPPFFSDSDMNIEFTSQLEKDATDAKALRVTPTK